MSPGDGEVDKPLSPIGEIWERKMIICLNMHACPKMITLYLSDIIGSNTSISLAIKLGVLQLSKVQNLWTLLYQKKKVNLIIRIDNVNNG